MRAKPSTLLVQPPYGEPKMEPAGLLYLATWLRQHGYPVDLVYESWLTRLTPEVLRAAVTQAEMHLADVVLANLDEIHARFVMNVARPRV